jgi:hypothetical protein
LISLTDYGANLIWELVYFTLTTPADTKLHFFAFGQPREFNTQVAQGSRVIGNQKTRTQENPYM